MGMGRRGHGTPRVKITITVEIDQGDGTADYPPRVWFAEELGSLAWRIRSLREAPMFVYDELGREVGQVHIEEE